MANSKYFQRLEKDVHYEHLRYFRVDECPKYKMRQCQFLFVCFNWHEPNQRRRRPLMTRDGSFNYSSMEYCTKYNATTGICPNGDVCPFLHQVQGNIEYLYHLRNYKTANCFSHKNGHGQCQKNGRNCAFAHGVEDLRLPVVSFVEEQRRLAGGGIGKTIHAANINRYMRREIQKKAEQNMMLHRKSSLPIWETEPEQGLTRENYHEKEADDAAKERHLMAKTQEQLEKDEKWRQRFFGPTWEKAPDQELSSEDNHEDEVDSDDKERQLVAKTQEQLEEDEKMRLQSLRPIWETKVVKGLTQEDFQNINRKAIQQSKEEVDATNLMEANQEVSKQIMMWHKRIWDTMKTDQNNNQQVAQQSDKPNFSKEWEQLAGASHNFTKPPPQSLPNNIGSGNSRIAAEINRLREELARRHLKIHELEAKVALCEMTKQEENEMKAKVAIAETQRDEAVQSVQALAKKVEMLRAATEPCPKYFSEYSIQKLKCFESNIRSDLTLIENLLESRGSITAYVQKKQNSRETKPL